MDVMDAIDAIEGRDQDTDNMSPLQVTAKGTIEIDQASPTNISDKHLLQNDNTNNINISQKSISLSPARQKSNNRINENSSHL